MQVLVRMQGSVSRDGVDELFDARGSVDVLGNGQAQVSAQSVGLILVTEQASVLKNRDNLRKEATELCRVIDMQKVTVGSTRNEPFGKPVCDCLGRTDKLTLLRR